MTGIKEAIKSSRSTANTAEGKSMLQGNISLVLDSYNDIFSNFDPRPFTEKSLSDDFLIECKKAARDKEEGVELRLLIQAEKRNLSSEIKIKRRLKEHFQRHYHEELKKIRKIKKEGIIWFILGTIFIIVEAFLYAKQGQDFFIRLLLVILLPAGWFFFWEGLDKVFIDARERMPELEFYKKMSTAEIYFFSY